MRAHSCPCSEAALSKQHIMDPTTELSHFYPSFPIPNSISQCGLPGKISQEFKKQEVKKAKHNIRQYTEAKEKENQLSVHERRL